MAIIDFSPRASSVVQRAASMTRQFHHEFITPEHLLFALLEDDVFADVLSLYGPVDSLTDSVADVLDSYEQVPDTDDYAPQPSQQLSLLLATAHNQVDMSSAAVVDITHLTVAMLQLEESFARFLLLGTVAETGQAEDFISELIGRCEQAGDSADGSDADEAPKAEGWRSLVTCLNDIVAQKNPLIGREKELQRTIEVLCRRDKNNPLHVGEPGVGKTALVYGLTALIVAGKVPRRLAGSRVYQLDLGTMLAGTQYRGDFEKRIKQVMDGISAESPHNIIYIDEIHNLVGAGAIGESSMDASNMLKPYLESGTLRFIGSTTYEEYNRYFSRSKGLVRRFQQIDLQEPGTDEAIHILQQLRPRYEEFHGVTYDDDAIETAVTASARYVNDRFLPDKAIDLIDEAGAAMQIAADVGLSPTSVKLSDSDTGLSPTPPRVTKAVITDILAKTCKVEAAAMKHDDDNKALEELPAHMLAQIYGQDEAVRQVVEAVQMARAGLLDDGKPLASLLFVGPTGVGKTEVARVLARELGIELLRFDMSEYTEKHAVAKLIGSPAGYVGYEDGGLLTDAIRRAPNSVLLLDEIEKAHADIYNILLQVMDYARLTDNKGRKADFQNVIVIMTSNAGAQYASQASVGFGQRVERGEAMLRQVKKTFKPEFINRLSATVVFHDMDRPMAVRILRKKLDELRQKLAARQVTMTLSDAAFGRLLDEGFTREYGAREMDRVIGQRLKPLLTRELLFGSLRKGGHIDIDLTDDGISIRR